MIRFYLKTMLALLSVCSLLNVLAMAQDGSATGSELTHEAWFALVAEAIAEGDMSTAQRARLIERALHLAHESPLSSGQPTPGTNQSILIRNPTLAPYLNSLLQDTHEFPEASEVEHLRLHLDRALEQFFAEKCEEQGIRSNPFQLPSYVFEHRDEYGAIVDWTGEAVLAEPESYFEEPTDITRVTIRGIHRNLPVYEEAPTRVSELPSYFDFTPIPMLPVDGTGELQLRR